MACARSSNRGELSAAGPGCSLPPKVRSERGPTAARAVEPAFAARGPAVHTAREGRAGGTRSPVGSRHRRGAASGAAPGHASRDLRRGDALGARAGLSVPLGTRVSLELAVEALHTLGNGLQYRAVVGVVPTDYQSLVPNPVVESAELEGWMLTSALGVAIRL